MGGVWIIDTANDFDLISPNLTKPNLLLLTTYLFIWTKMIPANF